MNQELSFIWERCLQFMRENLDAQQESEESKKLRKSFDITFERVYPISWVDGNLTLYVPSDFYKEYIEENYINMLSVALRNFFGKKIKLYYSNKMLAQSNVKGMSMQPPKNQQASPVFTKLVNPLVAPGIPKVNIESNLNPNLTFDNYIEGESNKFASTVGRSIAKRPGITAFNPLFLYGGVGVGKTHLTHAIGMEIKRLYPEKVVHYISSETFIQKFIAAAKSQNKTDFQNFFQMIDVLIIDDIQFLSSKTGTQEAFFHIFDHLHQNGKQIILTSDRAPSDIQDIQERVISRFKWGVTTEIKSPDFVTRRDIIVDKLSIDGIVLPDEMIDYLAYEVNSNVRELIGVINSVIAYATVYKMEPTLELLKETIDKIATKQNTVIDIPYIQDVVCSYFGVEKEHLVSKSRKREYTLPRQLSMYFAKELTNSTFKKIGKETGGRDHATVMHACDTIRDLSNIDREIKKYVKDLSDKIKN